MLQCNGMKTVSPLIVGNWKLNPETLHDARDLFLAIRKRLPRQLGDVAVVVAPPFPFISELRRLAPSGRIALAAQTAFAEMKGAHTGEVSLPMLESVGVTTVILGHSERRAQGEQDAAINASARAALKRKLTTIVCVGELERDTEAGYFGVVEGQLIAALRDIPKTQLKDLVIAYEPVWAIGTGATATPEDAHEMKLFIQKVIVAHYGRPALKKVRIIYGGSVKPDNAAALLDAGAVDGFLIGGASLVATEFIDIIKTASTYVKRSV